MKTHAYRYRILQMTDLTIDTLLQLFNNQLKCLLCFRHCPKAWYIRLPEYQIKDSFRISARKNFQKKTMFKENNMRSEGGGHTKKPVRQKEYEK